MAVFIEKGSGYYQRLLIMGFFMKIFLEISDKIMIIKGYLKRISRQKIQLLIWGSFSKIVLDIFHDFVQDIDKGYR